MLAIGEDPESTGTHQHVQLMRTIARLTLELQRQPTVEEIKGQVFWRLTEHTFQMNKNRHWYRNP